MVNTLGGTDLGTITRETHTKDSGIFKFPLPRSDSSSALLVDLMGTSRVITLEGTYSDTTNNINTFISTIEGYIAGTQGGKTYVSNQTGSSYTVFIQDFTWTAEGGGVNKITYTLTLLQGVAIT